MSQLSTGRWDRVTSAALFVGALALYVRTLAPTVAFIFDDTLEFQYIVPRLGILHPTGYPLYALLGKLFTLLIPLGDPAFRLNLLSAVAGALAIAFVFLVLRQLNVHWVAALTGALTFAVTQTFWSQAVVAEIYTTQMLIVAVVLYLALIWREEVERGNGATSPSARRKLYALAFAMGVGLAHHRLILLLFPAIALYVLLVDRSVLREWRMLARAAIFLLLPLAFYAYLPLRSAVGSADGTYQNTFEGFWTWVTALEYSRFLTENPLQVQHDAAYFLTLFQDQFGVLALALAAIGVVWLLNRPREWALLAAGLLLQAVFVFNYRTADVQVHFLTIFMLLTVLAGVGADGLFKTIGRWQAEPGARGLLRLASVLLLSLLMLSIPVALLVDNFGANDLSNKWQAHDYGVDILSQPLAENAVIIGIQGEVTLVRYLQETQGLGRGVQTIAADKEEERLAAVDQALAKNQTVYLTRQLKGVERKYSLSSLGPLIRVQRQPVMAEKDAASAGQDMAEGIRLLDSKTDGSRLVGIPDKWHAENGRVLRVTLQWLVEERVSRDLMVSLKLSRKDQHILAQVDHRPVLGAYPTTAWRAGELVVDSYDLPVFVGAPAGEYVLNVTMYEPESGVIVGQRDVGTIALAPDLVAPRREAWNGRDVWNVARAADENFGAFALAGYEIQGEAPIRPGDPLPVTLLWRAGAEPVANNLVARVWLEDTAGKVAASRDFVPGGAYPISLWQPGQYVRDWPAVRIPANIPDGQYGVKLVAARSNRFLGADWLPFDTTVASLGQITVKNRVRVMAPPLVENPLEATFDRKIKLLGYELTRDVTTRGVRVTLYWKAVAQVDALYTVFVHVLDGKGDIIATGDAMPGNGDFPTTGWIENEFITDAHGLTLPPDLPAGGYPIEIGLYDPTTGVRLKSADGKDHVILTSINDP